MADLTQLALAGAAIAGLLFLLIRRLYPKPLPGIPYNEASAHRLMGDIPDWFPLIKQTHEFSDSMLNITTRKLGTPIAQLLFPNIRKPLVVVDDAREIEDILVRRGKEFDKAPTALGLFGPMFPRATLSQYTTPALKAQKRLWADVMSPDFLKRVAAPNIHKATCELLDLWRLKAEGPGTALLNVIDDFRNAALDAIWVAVVGEEPGTMRYEIQKLRHQLSGSDRPFDQKPPVGEFLKEQVHYIGEAVARSSNSVSPELAQRVETWTPRYRRFRSVVSGEMRRAMRSAVERFQHLETERLEDDAAVDTCAMDLVLRRQILQARKAGVAPSDPTKDEAMLDEMFVMLVGGHDSTGNTLSWFVRFMEMYPSVQSTLRAILRSKFPGPDLPSAQAILDADIPYLDGVCEEGMRLSGTAKANLRQAIVDTRILGCPVPKGTEIFFNFHTDRETPHVDEAVRSESSRAAAEKKWNSVGAEHAWRDLGTFEPRRWIERDKSGKEVFNAYALPSLAFGGGYRGCFGRKLAMLEFKIVVVLLIMSFEFLPLPDEYRPMSSVETVFRQPDFPYANIKVL
ncbi:cytochrome P450 3A24 [Echria macrotheca]|uniref:Cytochrome P450 3A24 n=1 Tax=Echria macrotheca TaxID=438768 RepID=A0AAJ0F912_9PEZI|nr:cytochrome P450 3A24 [Echria macrotheca]